MVPEPSALAAADDGSDPRDRISLRLLELVPFDLPESVVRQELNRAGRGEIGPGGKDWQAAADRIRLMLIFKRISRREGIEVDEKDVDARIAGKAVE